MRVTKWQGRIWAARLGLLALALNAVVPIHLAFDIAEALEPPHRCDARVEVDSAERYLLALLAGHHEANGRADEHGKHHACPVCSALGTFAALALPTPPALLLPILAGLPATLSLPESESVGAPAAYRSRAPPVA